MVALLQPDMKRLVAYSSVSHLGFVMLGLAAGIEGTIGLVIGLVAIVANRRRLPYTVTLVVIGLLIAIPTALELEATPDLILAIFVPPLVFEAAFHLDLNQLRENLAPILERLRIREDRLVESIRHFEDWFGRALGRVSQLVDRMSRRGQRPLRSVRACAATFL